MCKQGVLVHESQPQQVGMGVFTKRPVAYGIQRAGRCMDGLSVFCQFPSGIRLWPNDGKVAPDGSQPVQTNNLRIHYCQPSEPDLTRYYMRHECPRTTLRGREISPSVPVSGVYFVERGQDRRQNKRANPVTAPWTSVIRSAFNNGFNSSRLLSYFWEVFVSQVWPFGSNQCDQTFRKNFLALFMKSQ